MDLMTQAQTVGANLFLIPLLWTFFICAVGYFILK